MRARGNTRGGRLEEKTEPRRIGGGDHETAGAETLVFSPAPVTPQQSPSWPDGKDQSLTIGSIFGRRNPVIGWGDSQCDTANGCHQFDARKDVAGLELLDQPAPERFQH